MTTHSTTVQIAATSSRRLVAAMALMAGLGIVFIAGLANSDTMHNAAHDWRHSMSFPCH